VRWVWRELNPGRPRHVVTVPRFRFSQLREGGGGDHKHAFRKIMYSCEGMIGLGQVSWLLGKAFFSGGLTVYMS
jgi:hypothetical protein